MNPSDSKRTRAQESRAAIQRLYIAMRHLFIRGGYKPLGISGEAMIEALMVLRPEIYGSITDPEQVELKGLLYVLQRLPQGIEECRYIKLISREGFERSHFQPIVPSKRRRNCYRIDQEQIFIEMTRGRSDIYDILTHLTFLYIEAEKIRHNSLDSKGRMTREWKMLEEIVRREEQGEEFDREVAFTYLSTILGRPFHETVSACREFAEASQVNSIFRIAYWLGKLSMDEANEGNDRQITFSSSLREKVGHHIYGELWANHIKSYLYREGLIDRPIHLISANLHSVMNSLYGLPALKNRKNLADIRAIATALSKEENVSLRHKVVQFALQHGMTQVEDDSGTNIAVQIFDLARIKGSYLPEAVRIDPDYLRTEKPILLVMDYAFGEQAYEAMDELLKPYEVDGRKIPLKVHSISVMGKAGILEGKKGDIMIPHSHVFEGTADNYPFDNDLTIDDFAGHDLGVYAGSMISVLGTSLQNKDILHYFLKSSWKAVGLEMEGAHYQKAIQAAAKIRRSIHPDVVLRYAYYASDNPLESGQTLASGSLGEDGVKPTYLITLKILDRILFPDKK
ncbi:MAG: hypothetical protein KDC43_01535 [Saprospiraceae bacterium]|nr:hypothetical protein [Saprospiraceae bacterium]MCB0622621.1 hypothetical protein [Saprospiraceae bacterium]MCB0676264.1 hypothetical protein [Saprospiraceae bacterium]MCB0681928.1 hypothetical protein [Saprospiraceae bacterium]